MYPGFIAEYNDQSDIPVTLPVTEVRNQPLFAAIFTSDKGPEGWKRVSGKEFFNLYGNNISFERHGQPLLQAAMSINAGAELLCKRLVAEDATLANLAIFVKISDKGIVYTITSGKGKTEDEIIANLEKAELEKAELEGDDYVDCGDLLYLFTDNGRGISKKKIKITPNYKLSKNLDYTLYTLSVYEGSVETESISFALNPNLIVSGENISLVNMVNTHSSQIRCYANDKTIEDVVEAFCDMTGEVDVENNAYKHDLIFGRTNRGEAITITISTDDAENPTTTAAISRFDGNDLGASYGAPLLGGDNGLFDTHPFKEDTKTITEKDENGSTVNKVVDGPIRTEYVKQAVAALSGQFDTVIFNTDQFMIDAFVDANYPDAVKSAIATLAKFREDFVFFRDMGIGKTDIDMITTCNSEYADDDKTMFCANYCQSYDVIDPYTKKQISVTIGYDLAQKLVSHCNNGVILPTAGMKYNMTIDNAIYGTLSFAPTICPEIAGYDGNQKEKLSDMKVNYASYINNRLVIESLYTAQDRKSQWSFINNVMGIQKVVKAIRTRCPAIRYTFIDGEDLELYKSDIEEVIAPFQSDFKQLSVEFVADATYAANKIFYAVLKVAYKDFEQTEWFKVTALSAVESVKA